MVLIAYANCIRAVSPEPLHIYNIAIDEGLDQELDI